MSVLLFCLAIAMIVAGSTAVYSGSLIISIERGWSMMIAGSVCASAGAIVLGLAVLAGRLGRISRQAENLGETMSRIEMTTWGPPPPLMADDVEEGRSAPSEPEPIEQAVYRAEPVTERVLSPPEADISPSTSPMIVTAPTAMPSAAARVMEPAIVQDSVPAEPTVVGSYSAGENAYLMYSDGSIQADTPEGRFRFGSLDELKAYVADGERKAGAARSADPEPRTSPETAEIAKA